ncbi:MAG: MGMT family protein [bacterium]
MKTRPATSFENMVYDSVRRIPAGRVSTYGAVARAVQCSSPQAVGQALRRNPFAPEVPCHRVIASDLSPGGFAGATGGPVLARKIALLEREGVVFTKRSGRLTLKDPALLCTPY